MNERHPEDSKIIDFMLAHKPKGTVEAAYTRAMYLDRRQGLGQLWADLLMEKRGPANELLLGPRKIFAR